MSIGILFYEILNYIRKGFDDLFEFNEDNKDNKDELQ